MLIMRMAFSMRTYRRLGFEQIVFVVPLLQRSFDVIFSLHSSSHEPCPVTYKLVGPLIYTLGLSIVYISRPAP